MPSRLLGPRLSAVESPWTVSANTKQRPCAVRGLRSLSSHGRIERIRNGRSHVAVLQAIASAGPDAAQPSRDDWPTKRDRLISSLSDIDSTSSVLRIGALMNSYSVLLECSADTLAKASAHVLRTPILDVVVEGLLSSSARHQCAAVGMVSFLILGCGPTDSESKSLRKESHNSLQDAALLFATFQDMLPWQHTVTLALQSCSMLLRHDEPQFRWAAMRYLMTTAAFPIVLNAIRQNDALQTQIAQCAMHGVLFGPDEPLPKCPSFPPAPGTEPSLQNTPSKAFSSDPRSPRLLALDMAHCAFHILPLLLLFSESRAQHFAHVRGTAVAMLLERQSSDLLKYAPHLLRHLNVGIGAESSSPGQNSTSHQAAASKSDSDTTAASDAASSSIAETRNSTSGSEASPSAAAAAPSTPGEEAAPGSNTAHSSTSDKDESNDRNASSASDVDAAPNVQTPASDGSSGASSSAKVEAAAKEPAGEPESAISSVPQSRIDEGADKRLISPAIERYVQASEQVFFSTVNTAVVLAMTYLGLDTDSRDADSDEPSAASLAQNPSEKAQGKGGDTSGLRRGSTAGGVPPLTVANAAASNRQGQVPEEIVQWLQKAVMRSAENRSRENGGVNSMQPMIRLDLSQKELKEFTALLEKHGVDIEAVTEGATDGSATDTMQQDMSLGSNSSTRASSMQELQDQGDSNGASNMKGTMVASTGSSMQSSGFQLSGPGTKGPQARVGTALGGIGGDVAQMLGSHPPKALTLAAKDHEKAGILISLFPAASGDLLMPYFCLDILQCKFPSDGHETDYVLPQPDVTEDLSDFVSALEKLEAVVQGIPAPALDDQQARRLSHATRAPAAAMLAAIWSPRLAEPLQSISPSLASVAHAEMLNGLTMAATNGFPSMVLSKMGQLESAAWNDETDGMSGMDTEDLTVLNQSVQGSTWSTKTLTGDQEDTGSTGISLQQLEQGVLDIFQPLYAGQLEEEDVEAPLLPLLRALSVAMDLPAPLAQWSIHLLHASMTVSFPLRSQKLGTTGMPAVDNDADFAAYQLSQLLGILAIRAEEVSKAAQGPAALGLSYGTAPPTPADVPWLRFASKRKPVLAWMTAAYYVILNGWRAVTSWAEGIKKLIGRASDQVKASMNQDSASQDEGRPARDSFALRPVVKRAEQHKDVVFVRGPDLATGAFNRWVLAEEHLAPWADEMFSLLEYLGVSVLTTKLERKNRTDIIDGLSAAVDKLQSMGAQNENTWGNLAVGAASMEPSYQRLSCFTANGCFLSPPVTFAAFTSGQPVGRRALLSDKQAEAPWASVMDVRWVARLEGLSANMAQRVPYPYETMPAPSDKALPEGSSEGSKALPVSSDAGDCSTSAQVSRADAGSSNTSSKEPVPEHDFSKAQAVFTAQERLPLASAWGIEDCSATLLSAFGALAQHLQERPGDGDAALRLYERNKTLLSLATEELKVATNRGLSTLRYIGAPAPHWHTPLLLLHSAARSQWPQPLLGPQDVDVLLKFARTCLARLQVAADCMLADMRHGPDQEAEQTLEDTMPLLLPLSSGDALSYLTVTLDTLIVLAAAHARSSNDHPDTVPPLTALSELPDLLFDALFVMAAFDTEHGNSALTRVYTTPLNRFLHIHCTPHYFNSFPGQADIPVDPFSYCRTENSLDPHYLTDYVTPKAALRTALAGIDAALRRGATNGEGMESLRARLRQPELLSKIRVQLSQPGACAQQAVSLLASALISDPSLAAAFNAQSIPGSVMRVFKATIEEITSNNAQAVMSPVGHHLQPAQSPRVAAVCVQFFLRMAVAQPAPPPPQAPKAAQLSSTTVSTSPVSSDSAQSDTSGTDAGSQGESTDSATQQSKGESSDPENQLTEAEGSERSSTDAKDATSDRATGSSTPVQSPDASETSSPTEPVSASNSSGSSTSASEDSKGLEDSQHQDVAEKVEGKGNGAGQMVAGAAVPGKFVSSIARLPRLVLFCLILLSEGDDAGQKLAAELLRVLVSQRQARLALRDAGGLETLMLCLTSSPPQVQQSAFDALKILWSSEDGDEQHLLQMRQARLANPGATATRVELVSQGMRELVFNSTWPVVDTTATSVKVTSSATQPSTTGDTTPSTANEANDVDNTYTLEVEVESQAATEPLESSSSDNPQRNEADPGIGSDPASSMESFVVNAASDGSDEGEIVGAVGVSKEGLVKLYVLEELPEEALTQMEEAVPAEPARVQACMDMAVEFARAQNQRSEANRTDQNDSESANSTSADDTAFIAQMSVDAAGTPSDIPFQKFTAGDQVVGRIVLDARDMSARCVGFAALTESAWQELFSSVIATSPPEPPLPPTPLYGSLGATWLNTVKEATLRPPNTGATAAAAAENTSGQTDSDTASKSVSEGSQDVAAAAYDALDSSKEKWDAESGGLGVDSFGVTEAWAPDSAQNHATPDKASENVSQGAKQPAGTLGDVWDSNNSAGLTDEERQLAQALGRTASQGESSDEAQNKSADSEKSQASVDASQKLQFDPLGKKTSTVAPAGNTRISTDQSLWSGDAPYSIAVGSMQVTFIRDDSDNSKTAELMARTPELGFWGATPQPGPGLVGCARLQVAVEHTSDLANGSSEVVEATVVSSEGATGTQGGATGPKSDSESVYTVKTFSTDANGQLVEETSTYSKVSDAVDGSAVTDAAPSGSNNLTSHALEFDDGDSDYDNTLIPDPDMSMSDGEDDSSAERAGSMSQLLNELGFTFTPLTELQLSEDLLSKFALPDDKQALLKRASMLESDNFNFARRRLLQVSPNMHAETLDQIIGELSMKVRAAADIGDNATTSTSDSSREPGSAGGDASKSSSVLDKELDEEETSGMLLAWSLAVVRMMSGAEGEMGCLDLKRTEVAVAATNLAEATMTATMAELSEGLEEFLVDSSLQERLAAWEVLLSPVGDRPVNVFGSSDSDSSTGVASQVIDSDSDDDGSAVPVAVPLEVVYSMFESMATALRAFKVVVDQRHESIPMGGSVKETHQCYEDIKWLGKHFYWAFEQATGIPADVIYNISAGDTFMWEDDELKMPSLRRRAQNVTNTASTTINSDATHVESAPEAVEGKSETSGSGSDEREPADSAQEAEGQGSTPSQYPRTIVPTWMQSLSREQMCEYFIKQRDEFAQIGEMLVDREVARKAAIDQYGSLDQASVPDAAAQYADPSVVWEQQEVLADIDKNLKLLYRQTAAQLGTDEKTLASLRSGPGALEEMKQLFCPSEENSKEDYAQEQFAAYSEVLCAVVSEHTNRMPPLEDLDEPPRVANGKKKADRALVERVREEAMKLLKSSEVASEALKSASDAVDAAELASYEASGTDESGMRGSPPSEAIRDLVDPKPRMTYGSLDDDSSISNEAIAMASYSPSDTSPELRERCQKYIVRLSSQNENEVQQACWELTREICTDGPKWLRAATDTSLDRALLALLRMAPHPVAAAAAAFAAFGTSTPARHAAVALHPRNPELLPALAAGLSARGGAAGEELRYQCACALLPLIVTEEDRELAGRLCLARACTLLQRADLEAEILVMLELLGLLCVQSLKHMRQVAYMGVLPRVQHLMAHPHPNIRQHAVHLIGVVASNPDNTPALRLHLLHHQLAALIKAAAVPAGPSGPPQELTEIAVLATGTACALLARRYAFGRRWKIDSSVAASFVDAGVFVAATAFAQYSSMSCQHFGLRLLLLGLESDIPQVKRHIVELGVVPLAWRLRQEAAEKIRSSKPSSGRRRRGAVEAKMVKQRQSASQDGVTINSSQEPENRRDAAVLVESVATSVLAQVDGDSSSMAAVAAAGSVPLRAWLLASGPLGPRQDRPDGESGPGGPDRFRKPDDGRGGGSLAYLK